MRLAGLSDCTLAAYLLALRKGSLFHTLRLDQAILFKSNQIGTPSAGKRLHHQAVIFRIAILNEGALQSLFVGILRHVHGLHGQGVQLGVVHTRGQRAWRGIKILHLLRVVAHIAHIFGQLNGFIQP